MLIAVTGILIGGFQYYQYQRNHVRQEYTNQLLSMTDLKCKQLIDWRNDLLSNAELFLSNPFTAEAIEKILTGKNDPLQEKLLTRFQQQKSRYGYREIILTDATGKVFSRLTGGNAALAPDMLSLMDQCRRSQAIILSDLHPGARDNAPHIDVVGSVHARGETPESPVIGYVFFRLDATHSLYPLIQSWPVPTRTAETLLVRREGETVLFLNELRHQTNAALKLSISLTRTNVPAVMAVRGKRGVDEGIDYRGVPVLSVLEKIPDSNWYLISKIDTAEIFAPWNRYSRIISALILVLLITTIVGAGLIWQQQGKTYYQALYHAEQERSRAAEALKSANQQLLASEQQLRAANQQLRAGTQQLQASNEQLRANEQQLSASNEKLRISEIQLLAILESTADGILAVDNKGAVIQASQRFATLWRIPQALMDRRDDRALLDFVLSQLVDPEAFLKTVQSLYNSNTEIMDIITFKDGRLLERHSLPILLNGRNIGRVWSFSDITERKRAENREKDLSVKLERAARMESLGVLAGGMAHDLNNVLGPIVLLPDLVNDFLARHGDPADPDYADTLQAIKAIKDSALRAAGVVSDLVMMGRRGQFQKNPVNISQVVKQLMGSAQIQDLQTRHPDVQMTLQLPNETLWFVGSELRLVRVLANLASNAVEAIDGKGDVVIRVDQQVFTEPYSGYETIPPGNYVTLEVTDTGCGIDTHTLPQIFEPFFSTKARSTRSGSGLGLSVVHGLVRDHEGFLNVESEPGKGTTFRIYLPSLTGDVIAENATKSILPGGHERILVVDDEPGQLFLTQLQLKKLGYNIVVVSSGEEAVALFESARREGRPAPFDLAIVDIIMPGMDGVTTCTEILRRWPEQKLLIASGHAPDGYEKQITTLGAEWLNKPFVAVDLARAVRTRLDRPGQGAKGS